ncbi:hypothetical protein E2C01_054472 [Portunus trituberculatus]|uniref:Uncharacterized protein n=1 Tax=Portunus trituberculatus TaxID=210409 RepID=A0A5B7GTA6_PORTR|nr:hypothetical protein [Portunus trituberculatus]
MMDYSDSANSVGKRTRDFSPSMSPDKNLTDKKAALEPMRDLLRDWGSNEELSSPGAASLPHLDGSPLALSSAIKEEEHHQQQEDDTQPCRWRDEASAALFRCLAEVGNRVLLREPSERRHRVVLEHYPLDLPLDAKRLTSWRSREPTQQVLVMLTEQQLGAQLGRQRQQPLQEAPRGQQQLQKPQQYPCSRRQPQQQQLQQPSSPALPLMRSAWDQRQATGVPSSPPPPTRTREIRTSPRQTHRQLEPRKRQVAWYATATAYQPLDASLQFPRAYSVLLHCIRLGFCTKEELYDDFEGQECEHCGRQSRYPLLHYLLSCPATAALRPPPPLPIQPAAGGLLSRREARVAHLICHTPTEAMLQVLRAARPPH